MTRRDLVLLPIAITMLGLVTYSFLGSWLNSHKGSTREIHGASIKLQGLINDFHAKTGRLPQSLAEIDAELRPSLTFDYPLRCENHFWEHTGRSTLHGATLERHPEKDGDGYAGYAIRLPRWPNAIPIVIKDPRDQPKE